MRTALAHRAGSRPPRSGRPTSRSTLVRHRSTVPREHIPLKPAPEPYRYSAAA
ncbi:hypothetical protein [Streptomyces sp. NPDC047070]|uniref:hypothetical protein n=1 Tax=Streptomyces sp. NPDC047070 TaxID=3154923 RepID=UPI003452176F